MMTKALCSPEQNGSHHGLIMVKPHAVGAILDPVIYEMLNSNKTSSLLPEDDPLRGMINNLEMGTPAIRDLKTIKYGEALLDLFYGDKLTRRYYPMIREFYLGRVVFLPFIFYGDRVEYTESLHAMKGTTETFDSDGLQLNCARGIRGALGVPYQFVSNGEAEDFDDMSYRYHFEPVVNNFVHICDKPGEVEAATRVLASPS
jgi:hypothetical protein